ncbi:WS/DGAT domain-containing protein [Actinoallomurus spadix]|uniref:diacylglycerol O-acyltransferase n=1 Tax=Actinoallomurus spadix TaxID=79912 RepID=A0ABN0XF24_9ACTN|nr:wax ester/triacylglycerol synthase domain-containing protein [Actinoallomurus spadix]MCO5988880.1 WS/DGAT domain-containing protein [Actinoallomurus spadix]
MTGRSPNPSAPVGVNYWTESFLSMDAVAPQAADPYFGFLLRGTGRAPDLEDLRERIARSLPALPALTHRPSTTEGRLRWTSDEAFDIRRHVRTCPRLDEDLSPAQQLIPATEPERPLWGIWLDPGLHDGRWELYFLTHHAVQDATGVLRTLRILLCEDPADLPGQPPEPGARPSLLHAVRAMAVLAPQVLSSYLPTAGWDPIDQVKGRRRRFAYAQVPTATLRTVADRYGASVTQVHLAAMTSALRALDAQAGSSSTRHRPLHVCLPLDTRQPGRREDAVGNHLGLDRIPLPWDRSSPAQQLRAITRTVGRSKIRRHKRAWEDVVAAGPHSLLGRLHMRVAHPARTRLTISGVNVPDALTCLGAPVTELIPLPWMPPGHACFTLMATYDGRTTLSVLTDEDAIAPEILTARWLQAVDELHAAPLSDSRF